MTHLFARCPWVHSDESRPPKTLGELKMDSKRDKTDPAIVITPPVIRNDPVDIDIAALFSEMTIATKQYPTVRDINAGGPKKRLGDMMPLRDELEEIRAVRHEQEKERLALQARAELLTRARAVVADQTPDSPSRKRQGMVVVDSPASVYPPRNPSIEEPDAPFFPSAKKRLSNTHVHCSLPLSPIQKPSTPPEVTTLGLEHTANASGAWSAFRAKPHDAPHVFGAQPAAETRSLSTPGSPTETSRFPTKPTVRAEVPSLFDAKPTVSAKPSSLLDAKLAVPVEPSSLFASKPTVPVEASSLVASKPTLPAESLSFFTAKSADTTPKPFSGSHSALMVTESSAPGFGSQLQSGQPSSAETDADMMDIERESSSHVTSSPFAPGMAAASPFAPTAVVASPFAPKTAGAGPFAPAVAVGCGSSGFQSGPFACGGGTSLVVTSTELPKMPSPFAGGVGPRPTAPAPTTPIVFGRGRIVPLESTKKIAWGSGAPRLNSAIAWGSGAMSSAGRDAVPSTGHGAVSSADSCAVLSTGRGAVRSSGSRVVLSSRRHVVSSKRRAAVPSTDSRAVSPSSGGAVSSTASAPGAFAGVEDNLAYRGGALSRSASLRDSILVPPPTRWHSESHKYNQFAHDGDAYAERAFKPSPTRKQRELDQFAQDAYAEKAFKPSPTRRQSESDQCHQFAQDAYAELDDDEEKPEARTRVILRPRVKAPPPSLIKPLPLTRTTASLRDTKVANPLGLQKKKRCFKCTFPVVPERDYCQRCINNGEEQKFEPDTTVYQPRVINRPEWESDGSRPTRTNIVARRMILTELGEKITPAMRHEERQFWGCASSTKIAA